MINSNAQVLVSLSDLELIKNALCSGQAVLQSFGTQDAFVQEWLNEAVKAYITVRDIYFNAMYQLDTAGSL